MTRTLVIQLGRLGDVIQSTLLLTDLATHGDEIDVLVLHSAHTALLGCPAVANIITIPDALKPLDDAIACGFPLGKIPVEARDLLAELLTKLRLPLYDRVINTSHAPLGWWLAAAVPCANPSARYGGIILDLILQTPLNRPMSAISLAAVFAASLHRLGRLSANDLRRELQSQNQSAWETTFESSNSSDPLGGLAYCPLHSDVSTHDGTFGHCLGQAFAARFLSSMGSCEMNPIESNWTAGSDLQRACDSLARTLDRLQAVASLCFESLRERANYHETQTAARELIGATDKLRPLALDPAWKSLSPIIHNLDWQLRMLPQMAPAATFRAHARSYAEAVRLIRDANAVLREIPPQGEIIERTNFIQKGEGRGGTGASFGEDTGTCPSARVGLAMNDSCRCSVDPAQLLHNQVFPVEIPTAILHKALPKLPEITAPRGNRLRLFRCKQKRKRTTHPGDWRNGYVTLTERSSNAGTALPKIGSGTC